MVHIIPITYIDDAYIDRNKNNITNIDKIPVAILVENNEFPELIVCESRSMPRCNGLFESHSLKLICCCLFSISLCITVNYFCCPGHICQF